MADVLLSGSAMIGDELRARTRVFALDTIDVCLQLGTGPLADLIRPQLLRAATGVASNNRAASRCRSRREFVSRLGVVIEEADESELWLDILETKRHGPPDRIKLLRREASELRAIFVKSRQTAVAKLKKKKPDGALRVAAPCRRSRPVRRP